MGIQDRDYYRESSGFLDAWGRQGLTVWLIALTCGVFFGQCVTGDPARSPLVRLGTASTDAILSGELWRLVTPLFLHAGLWHLFANMLVLYFVGTRVEQVYGRWEFLAIYLAAGVFSGLVVMGAELSGLKPVTGGIGASGAVTALVVLFAFHFPRQQILLFFIIPMPAWVAALLFVGIDALGAAGVGRVGIGYFAHLGGALFGLLYYQTGFSLTGLFRRGSGTSSRRARPRLRVIPAEPDDPTPTPVGAAVESPPRPKEGGEAKEPGEDLEKRVDQVLAKVSQHGQDSLTPEEREILFKASELYKKRRK
jgi:membrane associated rhomboid family serine protease